MLKTKISPNNLYFLNAQHYSYAVGLVKVKYINKLINI